MLNLTNERDEEVLAVQIFGDKDDNEHGEQEEPENKSLTITSHFADSQTLTP